LQKTIINAERKNLHYQASSLYKGNKISSIEQEPIFIQKVIYYSVSVGDTMEAVKENIF
jgi:hypothetical protein